MVAFSPDSLYILIPALPALAFMLYALWNFSFPNRRR
jgi:hypothetical protein